MATVGTYLVFPGNTETAFNFYKSIFKSEFIGGINRMGDVPLDEGQTALSEDEKNKVMHVALPILDNHMLMGTDALESQNHKVSAGNNISISLHPDSKEEAGRLFNELSAGGQVEMPLQLMFWGDYYASFTDKFGINWMINYHENKE